jgi:hypothetical protein
MRAALPLPCGLLSATSALAGVHDMLIGLDEEVASDATGARPGKDAALVVDVSNPAKPRIRVSLPLMNSLLGQPTKFVDYAGWEAGAGGQFRDDEPGRQRVEDGAGH